MTVSPSSLSLSAPVGFAGTGSVKVVANSGSATFTLMTSAKGWQLGVQVTPPSDSELTAPALLQVTATAMLPGTYHGTITVLWNGGSAIIPITFYASASALMPPVMTAVVSSGSALPAPIAPVT